VIGAVVVLALLAFIGVAALLRARRGRDDRRRGGGW
jgi:hypothetical protein